MRHDIAVIGILGALIALAPPARAGTWQAIERIPGQTPVTLSVKKRPRLYYRVTAEASLSLTVEGPG